jgi:hypothetical protein
MTLEEKRERHRISNYKSYLRNAEKYREYARRYRTEHREKVLEATRKWKRENAEWRKEYRQLNRKRDYTTAKLWKARNKERVNARRRELHVLNPEKMRIYHRNRYYADREKAQERARESSKKRRTIHRTKHLEYRRKYREQNKDKVNVTHRRWTEENREEVRRKRRIYLQALLKNNPEYKLLHYMRNRVKAILKGERKCARTLVLLGTTIEHLKKHFESQFRDGMSWENYGLTGWHIDHIKPCASFDLTNLEEQKRCFHYTNLQPLWWWENLAKADKLQ